MMKKTISNHSELNVIFVIDCKRKLKEKVVSIRFGSGVLVTIDIVCPQSDRLSLIIWPPL
jgi:RNA:NAD 2'-phosphotransferase (TPT1/KptA family)